MADALRWAFDHGVTIGVVALALSVPPALAGVLYLWTLNGARFIAAGWVWRCFLHWWRTGRTGGAGEAPVAIPGGHSPEYRAFMASPA